MSYQRLKRVGDIAGTLLIGIALSGLCVLIIVLYFLAGERPLLFVQTRAGKNGKPFRLYKFRTLKNVDAPLAQRRFMLGSMLRFFSLDELPQLWNVLRGDMSLIGPRPLPVAYLTFMTSEQKKRHHIRPGITGWAQVNGRHQVSWNDKFEMDAFYVEKISFGLDLLIIFKTVLLLLSFRPDRSLEEAPFTGNP